MAYKPIIAVTGPMLPCPAMEVLSQLSAEVRVLESDLTIPDLVERLEGVEFYILGGHEYLDEEFFKKAPSSIRQICFLGTGHSGFVNASALRETEIALSCTPHANARSTAEFAFAMANAGVRDLIGLAARAKEGEWWLTPSRSLYRATVGVIGYGHVGREFVRLMRVAYNSKVLVWNRSDRSKEIEKVGGKPRSLEQVMSDSDVVSIHVDWPADSSEYLIGASELNGASERLVLVNTARAYAVDPHALKTFLQDNPRALALFDCYYDEPIGLESDVHDLLALPNFLVTPHSAYLTDDSHEAMAEMVIDNLNAFVEGMPAPHLVKF